MTAAGARPGVDGGSISVAITGEPDIVAARSTGRQVAAQLAFTTVDLTLISTAISEIARNIAVYAAPGEITFEVIEANGRRGIRVDAVDEGPGIPDVERAMQDGYSTGASLGVGLPGARRLMDDFEIVSYVGRGTRVTMTKWER